MTRKDDFGEFLDSIRGAAVAVVYSFAHASSPQEIWYDRWHSEVLSAYGISLQALDLEPFYIDVTSFGRQAFSGNLPPLLAAINLNAGIRPISNWALVPSIAQWSGIRVLPCPADVIIAGERKDLSYLLAQNAGLPVPADFPQSALAQLGSREILVKPRDLGGSEGIQKARASQLQMTREGMLYQEFIPGYDITVPVVLNPITKKFTTLPGIIYLPNHPCPPSWIHDKQTKLTGGGYSKRAVTLPSSMASKLSQFASDFGITTFCRLDLRLRTTPDADPPSTIDPAALVFIEINPMPTIRPNINFVNSIKSMQKTDSLYATLGLVRRRLRPEDQEISEISWLVAVSLYSLCTHNHA